MNLELFKTAGVVLIGLLAVISTLINSIALLLQALGAVSLKQQLKACRNEKDMRIMERESRRQDAP